MDLSAALGGCLLRRGLRLLRLRTADFNFLAGAVGATSLTLPCGLPGFRYVPSGNLTQVFTVFGTKINLVRLAVESERRGLDVLRVAAHITGAHYLSNNRHRPYPNSSASSGARLPAAAWTGTPLRTSRATQVNSAQTGRSWLAGGGMSTPGPSRAGMSSPSCPYCGAPGRDLGGLHWTAPGSGRPGKPLRRRRRFRRARRFLAMAVVLCLLGGIMFAGLLIVAPSVADAPALARALDKTHHAIYPGQQVPERFAASLVATEDHRFYSEAGIDPFAIVRVAAGDLTGKPDQGGATLYQQLAKILYVPEPARRRTRPRSGSRRRG